MKNVILVFTTMLLILSQTITVFAEDEEWICPNCGATATKNFCSECGEPKPSEEWVCPNCGETARGNFCSNCGSSKEEQSEEDIKQINGFRDYAWGASFEEVKADLETEFGEDSLHIEGFGKENSETEETESIMKGAILIEDYEKMSVAGYNAVAFWLFDTEGLCTGGYHFMVPWGTHFEEIKALYQSIYGEPGSALSRDEGAIAFWQDEEENTILMMGGDRMFGLSGMAGGVEVIYANANRSAYIFDSIGINLDIFLKNTSSNEGV